MPSPRYDAIVVGGGHHGTIIAAYLGAAGLTTAVFERRAQFGGGATSRTGPAPGFRMNICSHWTRFYGHPAYRDFDLSAEGLSYVFPDDNEGIVFEDGSSYLGFSAYRVVDPKTGRQEFAQDNVDKTYRQIQRFSQADADTYLALLDTYTKYWKPAFAKHRFSVPPPWGAPDPLESLMDNPDSGILPVYQLMTVRQLAYEFFESDELRSLFMRACSTSTGCFADDVMGLNGLLHCLPLVLSYEPPAVAIGASQSLSDALVSAGRKRGVEYFGQSEVDEILVSGQKATGVRLKNGETIKADVIVSNLGLPQTILRLLRDVAIEPKMARRLRNIHYDRSQVFWINVALHEAPAYRAARSNPGVGPQPRLLWGPKDPDYLASRYQHEIYLEGHARKVCAYTSCDTYWDPSRAPEGKHLVGIEEFAAPRRQFSPDEWKRIKASLERNLLDQWANYAPNITRDNVIAVDIATPYEIERLHPDNIEGGYSQGSTIASQMGRYRPGPGLSSYKTLLDNVYNCSSNLHSGSGIGRGSSYNCFTVMAEELGLRFPKAGV
jgi:phytoene dehydrogenase-like protein